LIRVAQIDRQLSAKKGGIVDLGKNSGFLQATDFIRHMLFTLATFSA